MKDQRIRIFTLVDDYSREQLAPIADTLILRIHPYRMFLRTLTFCAVLQIPPDLIGAVAMCGFSGMLMIAAALALPAPAGAQEASPQITVLSASFGSIGRARKLDIAGPLNTLCAGADERCDVFCSETSFGRYSLGRRPVCRVVYRCPDASVRSVEAAREEPILLRCAATVAETVAAQASELPPVTYTPPAR